MDLVFDIRGNLLPHRKNVLTLNEFKEIFVNSFDEDSSRHEIFENYTRYIEAFRAEITPNFKHWINGSFVTNRINPKDIDLVNLIDFEIAKEKYEFIKEKYINQQSLKTYKIDAYLVKIYPETHKEYIKTHSDLLYWEHWFGNTPKNRVKKRFPKGFIEISFD